MLTKNKLPTTKKVFESPRPEGRKERRERGREGGRKERRKGGREERREDGKGGTLE